MVVTDCICRRCGKEHRKKGRARPDCFCRVCRAAASRDYSDGLGFAPREPLTKRKRAKRVAPLSQYETQKAREIGY